MPPRRNRRKLEDALRQREYELAKKQLKTASNSDDQTASNSDDQNTPPSYPRRRKGGESKSDHPRGQTRGGPDLKKLFRAEFGPESKSDNVSQRLRQHVRRFEGVLSEKIAKGCFCSHFVAVLRGLFEGDEDAFKQQLSKAADKISPEILTLATETNIPLNVKGILEEAWEDSTIDNTFSKVSDNLNMENVPKDVLNKKILELKAQLNTKINKEIRYDKRKTMKTARDAIVILSILEKMQEYDKAGEESRNYQMVQIMIMNALDSTEEQVNAEFSINEMTMEQTEERQRLNLLVSNLIDFLAGFAGVVVDKADKVATVSMILSLLNATATPFGCLFACLGWWCPPVAIIGGVITGVTSSLTSFNNKLATANKTLLEQSLGVTLAILSVINSMLRSKQKTNRSFYNPYVLLQQVKDSFSYEAMSSLTTLGLSNSLSNWLMDSVWYYALTNDVLEGSLFTSPVFTLAVQPAMTLFIQYFIGKMLPSSKQERKKLRQDIVDSLLPYSGREAVTAEMKVKIMQDVQLALTKDQIIKDTRRMTMLQRISSSSKDFFGNRVFSPTNIVLTTILSPLPWIIQQYVNGDGYVENGNTASCTVTATSLYCSGDADHHGMRVKFTDVYDALSNFDLSANNFDPAETRTATEQEISGKVRNTVTKLLRAKNSQLSPVVALSDAGMILQVCYRGSDIVNALEKTNALGFVKIAQETVTNSFNGTNVNDIVKPKTQNTIWAHFTGSPVVVGMTHAEVNDIRQFVEEYGTEPAPNVDVSTMFDRVDDFKAEVRDFLNASDYEFVTDAQQRSNTLRRVRVMRKELSSGFSRYRHIKKVQKGSQSIFDNLSQGIKNWFRNTGDFFDEENVKKVREQIKDKVKRLENTDSALRKLGGIKSRSFFRGFSVNDYTAVHAHGEDVYNRAFVMMLNPSVGEDYQTVTTFLNDTSNTAEWWKSPVLSNAVDESVALVGQKDGTFEYGSLAEDYRKDLEERGMTTQEIEEEFKSVGSILSRLNDDRKRGNAASTTSESAEQKKTSTQDDADMKALLDSMKDNRPQPRTLLGDTPLEFGDPSPDIQEKIDQMPKDGKTTNDNNSWWGAFGNGVGNIGKILRRESPQRPPRVDYTDYTVSVHGAHRIAYALADDISTKRREQREQREQREKGGLAY